MKGFALCPEAWGLWVWRTGDARTDEFKDRALSWCCLHRSVWFRDKTPGGCSLSWTDPRNPGLAGLCWIRQLEVDLTKQWFKAAFGSGRAGTAILGGESQIRGWGRLQSC